MRTVRIAVHLRHKKMFVSFFGYFITGDDTQIIVKIKANNILFIKLLQETI